ncbi:MAG: SDR family NAD(P)-dependent oxidoreductase, partial [Bacteroidota bacterium]
MLERLLVGHQEYRILRTMNWDFTDRVMIITGAGIGIGFEIARQFILAGGAVVLNDIDPEMASQAAKKLIDLGGKCKAIVGDSSELVVIDQMVESAINHFGHLDYVVANAGITTFGDFLEYQAKD